MVRLLLSALIVLLSNVGYGQCKLVISKDSLAIRPKSFEIVHEDLVEIYYLKNPDDSISVRKSKKIGFISGRLIKIGEDTLMLKRFLRKVKMEIPVDHIVTIRKANAFPIFLSAAIATGVGAGLLTFKYGYFLPSNIQLFLPSLIILAIEYRIINSTKIVHNDFGNKRRHHWNLEIK